MSSAMLGALTSWRSLRAACVVASIAACLPACTSAVPRPSNVESLATTGWTVRRVGCLDVRVAPAHDRLVPQGALLLDFDFVNTCRYEARIDFTKVRVDVGLDDGRSVAFALFDPGHEVHPAALARGDEGAEAIEFDPPTGRDVAREIRSACLDLGQVSPESAAVTPLCLRRGGPALVPVETAQPLPVGARRNLPDREVSLVVGYRHFSRFGDGWEVGASPRLVSLYAPGADLQFRSYPVGSLFAQPDSPTAGARRVGCVDVRVEAVQAHVADASIPLSFTLGNRCSTAVRIALAQARVIATWSDGTRRALTLYDPASEVHSPFLDGRASGSERLQYVAPPDAPSGLAQSVCVDVSGLVPGQSATDAMPICVSRTGAWVLDDSVVGHQPFDAEVWRRKAWHMLMELGAVMNFVELRGALSSGTTQAGKAFDLGATPYRRTVTFGMDMHVFPWVSGPFYGGFALQAAAGPIDPNARLSAGGTSVRGDDFVGDVSGGVVGGLVWTHSTSTRLRADVTLGLRGILSEVFPPGCVSATCEWDVGGARPLVEPRLVFDEWFSPWWSIAAWVDADALYLPDFGVGLSLVFHSWAYDGVP